MSQHKWKIHYSSNQGNQAIDVLSEVNLEQDERYAAQLLSEQLLSSHIIQLSNSNNYAHTALLEKHGIKITKIQKITNPHSPNHI